MTTGGAKPTPMDGLVVDVEGVLTFTVDRFLLSYREFVSVPFSDILTWGTLSVSLLNIQTWGRFYQQAVALYTAHQIAKVFQVDYEATGMRDQSSTGIVSTKSASTSSLGESNSVSALLTGDDPLAADLAQTQYGLQLLALIKLVMPMASLVTGERLQGYGYTQYGWPQSWSN